MPILILSAYDHEKYILQAMQSGVQGFVLKDEAPDILPMAIRAVVNGETWLSGSVSHKLATQTFQGRQMGYGLTRREDEVFRLLIQGMSDTEIAARLHVTTRSIRCYLGNIYEKLGVHSRVQTVIKGLCENL